VLNADGAATPPESFRRGLQTSGLVFRDGVLWSLGDQRSAFPGHLYRISPATARLLGPPLQLHPPTDDPTPSFEEYRKIPNSDFEGLTCHPSRPDTFVAVTEDKTPWLAEIRVTQRSGLQEQKTHRANLLRLTPVVYPEGVLAWRDDSNFRLEACTFSADGETLFVVFERAADELPRVLQIRYKDTRNSGPVQLTLLPFPFSDIPPRTDKARARLNLNGLQSVQHGGRELLIAIARDQERLLVLDPVRNEIVRVLDLDLRTPTGLPVEWVSPEGLAVDPATARLWVINDPDSVRGNYRARATAKATGQFANYSPLLFEFQLSDVLGEGSR